jgi:hypothetical protein
MSLVPGKVCGSLMSADNPDEESMTENMQLFLNFDFQNKFLKANFQI